MSGRVYTCLRPMKGNIQMGIRTYLEHAREELVKSNSIPTLSGDVKCGWCGAKHESNDFRAVTTCGTCWDGLNKVMGGDEKAEEIRGGSRVGERAGLPREPRGNTKTSSGPRSGPIHEGHETGGNSQGTKPAQSGPRSAMGAGYVRAGEPPTHTKTNDGKARSRPMPRPKPR